MAIRDLFRKKPTPEDQRRLVRQWQIRLNQAIRQDERSFGKIKEEQGSLIEQARSADRVTRDMHKRKYRQLKIRRERTLKQWRKNLVQKTIADEMLDNLKHRKNKMSDGDFVAQLASVGLDARTIEKWLIDDQIQDAEEFEKIAEIEEVLSENADMMAVDFQEAEDAEFDSIMEAVANDKETDVAALIERMSTRQSEPEALHKDATALR